MDKLDQLTEFGPLSTENRSSKSLISRLFGKFGGVSSDSTPIAGSAAAQSRVPVSARESSSLFQDHSSNSHDGSHTPGSRKRVVKNEIRTLTNVLRRLMNIVDKKSSLNEGLKPYKDSEFRQSWMPDSSCKECYDCGNQFTTFLRRHHCRICGQIFCRSCCNQEVPGRIIGFEGGLRACTYCCRVMSDLMKESDDDMGTFRDNIEAHLSHSAPSSSDIRPSPSSSKLFSPSRKFSTSDSFEMPAKHAASVFDIAPTAEPMLDMTLEERQSLVKDSLQLKSLFFEMLDPVEGLQLTSKRHRLKVHHSCFQGNELVTWLVNCDKVHDSDQAKIIGQALLDAKFLVCLTEFNRTIFYGDYTLYQFRPLTNEENNTRDLESRRLSVYQEIIEDVPNWIQELEQSELHPDSSSDFAQSLTRSVSAVAGDLSERFKPTNNESNFDSDSRTHVTPSNTSQMSRLEQMPPAKEELHAGEAIPHPENETTLPVLAKDQIVNDQQTLLYNQFKSLYEEHITRLCIQLLEKSGISTEWTNILMDLSFDISHSVKPDVYLNKDQMDIAPYVHIKKVRSGIPSDSSVTYGVICTKSVLHRQMKNCIKSPLIMLLQSSIEYQRVTNKLSSLEPQILQEKEYLQNCVARICKYRPDVLLVESTVSHVAQQLLLEAGITVLSNVKTSVMNRVARMTMADLIPSIDNLINQPHLGTCYKFQTEVYRFSDNYYKTLMHLSGCPVNLGCTVMLRGSHFPDLIKVKSILMTTINACYHAKLEISYLIDQSASLTPELSVKLKRSPPSSKRTESTGREFETLDQACQAMILDYSPVVQVHPPYFETEKGRLCPMRHLFPAPLYWSPLLTGEGRERYERDQMKLRGANEMYDYRLESSRMLGQSDTELKEPHQFVKWGMSGKDKNKRLKALTAMFRASGGRLSVQPVAYDRNRAFSGFPLPVKASKNVDCLDIRNHQSIYALFSSYVLNTEPHHCVKPWIVQMCFYGQNDLTLGQFLDRYCFSPSYKCPRLECDVPVSEHIRRFVHQSSCLYLIIRKGLEPQTNKEQGDSSSQTAENSTVTWQWCKKCRKATPLVPLSPAAWHLSFARFLQIQFNGGLSGSQVGEDCVHSMSTHYHQYFQFKGAVAIFKPSGITLREVVFPSPHVLMEHKISNKDIESRVKRIHTHGLGFFSDIMEIICKIEANSAENKEKWKTNPDYKLDLESEKKWFTEETDRMQSALLTETDPLTDTSLNLQKLSDDAIRLQFHLARSVQEWNIKIERANTNEEKIGDKKRLEDRSPKHFGSVPQLYGVGSKEESVAGSIEIYQTTPTPSESVYSAAVSSKDPEGPVLSAVDIVERLVHNDSPSSFDSASGIFSSSLCNEYDLGHYHQSVNEGLRAGLGRALTVNSYDSVGSFVVCDASTSIETAVPPEHKGRNSEQVIMSSSAQSQMTPSDVNTQRSSENKNMADQVLPLPHADETIKAHEKLADEVTDVSAANTIKTASAAAALDHLDDSKYQAVGNKVAAFSSVTKDSRLLTRHSVANDGKEVTQRRGGSKRTKRLKRNSSRYLLESVKSAIMSTAEDIPLFIKPIDNPFSDNEHYLLPSTPNVPIIIYDEEPSSIIAYALGSHDYDEQLTAKAEMIAKGPSTMSSEKDIKTDEIEVILKLTSVSAVSESLSKSSKPPDTPTNLLVVGDSKSKDRSAPAEINPHIEMEFTEKSVSGEKTGLFYCKVYFAAEFKKLRELIYPEGEEQFIRSLSRCYKWNAKGGKSGLGFCKTQDDRFIMKQMVKQEVQSFLDFGPYYFDYLTESLTDSGFPKERCALAKILGVYKIGLKNFVTNAVFRQDVLIIENLFYNRHIGKVFDLKGSDRNRLTKRETSLDSVLLDENFMRYSKQNPIYVRNHTKLVLMNALMEDTQFLARHKVMDYSLLCGYDEDTKELVIGIIDYIRTFTWDKRLETYVKSSGFLGGQGKMPTIVSPEVYRNRFLEAMEKYFNVVPDRWSKFPYFYPVKM